MAKKYVVVCDFCATEAPLAPGDDLYGDPPKDWVMLKESTPGERPSSVEVVHLCSWACVGSYGAQRAL